MFYVLSVWIQNTHLKELRLIFHIDKYAELFLRYLTYIPLKLTILTGEKSDFVYDFCEEIKLEFDTLTNYICA